MSVHLALILILTDFEMNVVFQNQVKTSQNFFSCGPLKAKSTNSYSFANLCLSKAMCRIKGSKPCKAVGLQSWGLKIICICNYYIIQWMLNRWHFSMLKFPRLQLRVFIMQRPHLQCCPLCLLKLCRLNKKSLEVCNDFG